LADFKGYVTQEIPTLIERLAFVQTRLANLALEIANIEIDEHKEKTEAYVRSEHTSVTDRRNSASFQALHISTEIIKLKGERTQLEEEKSFLLSLIGWRIALSKSLSEVGV
jgi:hypothetical protein